MATEIDALLKQVPSNFIPIIMKNFSETCKNDTNLIDEDSWNADMVNYIKLELLFSLNADIIFLQHHVI